MSYCLIPHSFAVKNSRFNPPIGRKSNVAGFSLVEVLVSIVILSFGMLGMVGLQAGALQASREARFQSIASSMASELAEMMRGNKSVSLATGTANTYLINLTNSTGATPLAPTTAAYCLVVGSTACASDLAIANAQMTDWLSRLDTQLPGARVVVCSDSAPFDSNGLPVWACGTGANATLVIKIGWTRGSTNKANTGDAAFDRSTVPSIVLPITPGVA